MAPTFSGAIFLFILCSLNCPTVLSEFFFFVGTWASTPRASLSPVSSPVSLPPSLVHRVCRFHPSFTMRKNKANPRAPKPCGKQPAKRGQAGQAAGDDEDPVAVPKAAAPLRIGWGTARTDRLLDWLENNVEDQQRLFSDSAQDAKDENRRRRTAKSVKTTFYAKIVEYVFSVDEDVKVRDDLHAHGTKRYVKAVENQIAS